MNAEEYGRLLNTLLQAERAGAKLLAAYVDELPEHAPQRALLSRIQRDEAKNCAVLIHLLLDAGLEVSTAVGSFYSRGLTITDWDARFSFLNRGQEWVAEHIAAALPRLPASSGRHLLEAMYESHLENIALCEGRIPA